MTELRRKTDQYSGISSVTYNVSSNPTALL